MKLVVLTTADPVADQRCAAVALEAAHLGHEVVLVGTVEPGGRGDPTPVEARYGPVRVHRWPLPEGVAPLVPRPRQAVRDGVVRLVAYQNRDTVLARGRWVRLQARRAELAAATARGRRQEAAAGLEVAAVRGLRVLHTVRATTYRRGVRPTWRSSSAYRRRKREGGLELGWADGLEAVLADADVAWLTSDLLVPAVREAVAATAGATRVVLDVEPAPPRPPSGVDAVVRRRAGGRWSLAAGLPAALHDDAPGSALPVPSVRERAQVPPDAPVVLVSPPRTVLGAAALETLVDVLGRYREVHLVVLSAGPVGGQGGLRRRARAAGSSSRLHFVRERPDSVLRDPLDGVDAAVVLDPEVDGLPDAYLRAVRHGVPVLTHRTAVLQSALDRHGSGVAADLRDVRACERGLRSLLRWSTRLRSRLHAEGTGGVETVLDGDRLDTLLRDLAPQATPAPSATDDPSRPPRPAAPPVEVRTFGDPRRLGLGPANFAGQAWQWAAAAREVVPGLRTEVFAVERGNLTFDTDRLVRRGQVSDLSWQLAEQERLLTGFSHLLAEANLPLFGTLTGEDARVDLAVLARRGVRVGVVLHGTELRDPDRHAELEPFSPFGPGADAEWVGGVRRQARATRRMLEEFDGPVFVSTPDLLADAPGAVWLPVVVDPDRPVGGPVMSRPRPIVVHVPSSARLKGTGMVEGLLDRLHDAGAITFRPARDVPPDRMAALIADADIVLDQFALGSYGVLAAEAMLAGRVVVGHVRDEVREIARGLPLVEATPDTLEEVLLALVEDADRAREVAERSRAFALAVHGRARAGTVLREHLLDDRG